MSKYEYEYTGTGIIAFYVDNKRYEIAYSGHPRLSNVVELPRKLKEEVAKSTGLKLKQKGDE